jgi:hypothetical protein
LIVAVSPLIGVGISTALGATQAVEFVLTSFLSLPSKVVGTTVVTKAQSVPLYSRTSLLPLLRYISALSPFTRLDAGISVLVGATQAIAFVLTRGILLPSRTAGRLL